MSKMTVIPPNYDTIRAGIVELLKSARSAAARNVNSIMTATYWEIGRRIVEVDQAGKRRADYGDLLIRKLATDLSTLFSRGFGARNLAQMRSFYLAWPMTRFCRHRLQNLPRLHHPMRAGPIVSHSSSRKTVPATVVRLRPTAVGEKPTRASLLRDRSSTLWLVRSSTGPPD